ncbi:MAG: thrombospondin type 3 repeat-containing protein [Phycisphaerales bacterium]|nr:thrombospondin type 3 repeat-containing protein [Phycisphaerales bacterium]
MREVMRVFAPASMPAVRWESCHWFRARDAGRLAAPRDSACDAYLSSCPQRVDPLLDCGASIDPLWLLNAGIEDRVDRDHDGVPDAWDNCRGVFNPSQRDTDGDRITDACDTDDDNDGMVDSADFWPRDPSRPLYAAKRDTKRPRELATASRRVANARREYQRPLRLTDVGARIDLLA